MDKALEFLDDTLKKDDVIIIACSGGPDSLCLLSLVCEFKIKKNLTIVVGHVNHNLRKESKNEALFVKNYALKNNLIYEELDVDFENQYNEQKGHKKRYEFYFTLARKYKAGYIATAHHGDDLIETILMRISRGSTLEGYKGISKITKYDKVSIIRPLLDYTKEDILKYDKDNNIPYVIDKSNKSNKYTRNRYRKNILPFLKKEEKLVHLKYQKFSRECSDYINFVKDYINNLKVIKDNTIDITKLTKETDFIKRKVIEEVIKEIQKDDYLEINDKEVQELLKLFKGNNRTINLNNSYVGIKDYNKLIIKKDEPELNFNYELTKDVITKDWSIKFEKTSVDNSNYCIRLNSKEIKLPLKIRKRIDGDKMEILNLKGHKKVKDIFIDEKIDTLKRNMLPIVVDSNDTIIWLPGIKKSKFAKKNNEKYDIILKYEVKEK